MARGSITNLLKRRTVMLAVGLFFLALIVLIISLIISVKIFLIALALLLLVLFTLIIVKANFTEYDFPIEINKIIALSDNLADKRFMQYYIDLRHAFGPGKPLSFHFDKDGIPMYQYGKAFHYNPTFVGWNAISQLQTYIGSKTQADKEAFLKSAQWFITNGRTHSRLGMVWDHTYDWLEGEYLIKQPWRSSLAQGVAMSVLVRAYAMTKSPLYLETARKATKIFTVPVSEGGVRSERNGSVYYDEYPVTPSINVLDGFVYSLLGLYDLYRATHDQAVLQLFNDGLESVSRNIRQWDFHRMWSLYGSHGILSPAFYNKLNHGLCMALYNISMLEHHEMVSISEYATFWDPILLSLWKKIYITCAGPYLTARYSVRMARKGGNF